MLIEHLLRYIELNETRTEFEYCFDRKHTQNDCNIVSAMDDNSRLQQLQNNGNLKISEKCML